jgi:hypothetical protein
LVIGHLALALAISHWLWLLAMYIGYRLWLLVIDTYTKKCGYGYNPFWLLAIGYGYWLLIFALINVAMVTTYFGYWPL